MRTDAYYSSGMRIDFGYSRTSVQASKMRIKYAESVSLGKYAILAKFQNSESVPKRKIFVK